MWKVRVDCSFWHSSLRTLKSLLGRMPLLNLCRLHLAIVLVRPLSDLITDFACHPANCFASTGHEKNSAF